MPTAESPARAAIRIGTAGFRYPDWKGVVYPRDLPQSEWLGYYARLFSFVELNTTFYGMPTAARLESFAARVPSDFLFAVKAFQGLTHARQGTEPLVAEFLAALAPLRERGQLGAVLLQFPNSFRNREENREYLRRLGERFAGVPAAVEFRHREWVDDEHTFDLLTECGFGYVCVDEPRFSGLVPPLVRVTAELGYVRFHGRNYAKWWRPAKRQERYDYLYSEDELREWLPRLEAIRAAARLLLVATNNHRRGQAAINARMLIELLGEGGPGRG